MSLRQNLVPLVVCISATKGKISDEKLLENGTGLPTESWERKHLVRSKLKC